jgi:hypothetical protein
MPFRAKEPDESNRQYQARQWIWFAYTELVEDRAVFDAIPAYLVQELDDNINALAEALDRPTKFSMKTAAAAVVVAPAMLPWLPLVLGDSVQVNCFQISEGGAGTLRKQALYWGADCSSYFAELEFLVAVLKNTICEIEADLTFQSVPFAGGQGGVGLCELGNSIGDGLENAREERTKVYEVSAKPAVPFLLLGALAFVALWMKS